MWNKWRANIRNYTIFKQKLIFFLSAMLIIYTTIFLSRRFFFNWLTALTAVYFHTQSNSQLIKQILQSQQSLQYNNTHSLQHLIPNIINSPFAHFYIMKQVILHLWCKHYFQAWKFCKRIKKKVRKVFTSYIYAFFFSRHHFSYTYHS